VIPLIHVQVKYENDVVLARQRAREVAALVGLDSQDQVRVATAVSEIARNAFQYAGGGTVSFAVEGAVAPQSLLVEVRDQGPGIPDLERILAGSYRSSTGMGLGLAGSRRLVDKFQVDSLPRQGTTIRLWKRLPLSVPVLTAVSVEKITRDLQRAEPRSLAEEIQRQNQELLDTLEALRVRNEDLLRVNRELEETNRGIVALYAELEDKTSAVRRMSDLRAQFLSNMSHEFRTPLNSTLALSRLLLEQADGPLTEEQRKQVGFIQKAAQDLTSLVDDLLDMAKVEAGKMEVRPSEVDLSILFGTLRGMIKPLLAKGSVEIVFEDPSGLPLLWTDEGKLSQILRNLLSNALKFTEQGEIRLRAFCRGDDLILAVSDTGIGIPKEAQERIFEEYAQVDNRLQRQARGTGLGLPLSRKLAALLGGALTVESEPGKGSTFWLRLPLSHAERAEDVLPTEDLARRPVLIVEDSSITLALYERYLQDSGFQVLAASSVREAKQVLKTIAPVAVVLDILLPGGEGWELLSFLKADPLTRSVPVLVASILDDQDKGLALGADDFCVKPVDRRWLLRKLGEAARLGPVEKILVIDDEEVSRYLLRSLLSGTKFSLVEAAGGEEGLVLAREEHPQLIFLDLVMPGLSGVEVLHRLKEDCVTRDIPVFIYTSQSLSEEERRVLLKSATSIVAKRNYSRESVVCSIRDALKQRLAAGGRKSDG